MFVLRWQSISKLFSLFYFIKKAHFLGVMNGAAFLDVDSSDSVVKIKLIILPFILCTHHYSYIYVTDVSLL